MANNTIRLSVALLAPLLTHALAVAQPEIRYFPNRSTFGAASAVVEIGYDRRSDQHNFEFAQIADVFDLRRFIDEAVVRLLLEETMNVDLLPPLLAPGVLGQPTLVGGPDYVISSFGSSICPKGFTLLGDSAPKPAASALVHLAYDLSKSFRYNGMLRRRVRPSDVHHVFAARLNLENNAAAALRIATKDAEDEFTNVQRVVRNLSNEALKWLVGYGFRIRYAPDGRPLSGRDYWAIIAIDFPKATLLKKITNPRDPARLVLERSVRALLRMGVARSTPAIRNHQVSMYACQRKDTPGGGPCVKENGVSCTVPKTPTPPGGGKGTPTPPGGGRGTPTPPGGGKLTPTPPGGGRSTPTPIATATNRPGGTVTPTVRPRPTNTSVPSPSVTAAVPSPTPPGLATAVRTTDAF